MVGLYKEAARVRDMSRERWRSSDAVRTLILGFGMDRAARVCARRSTGGGLEDMDPSDKLDGPDRLDRMCAEPPCLREPDRPCSSLLSFVRPVGCCGPPSGSRTTSSCHQFGDDVAAPRLPQAATTSAASAALLARARKSAAFPLLLSRARANNCATSCQASLTLAISSAVDKLDAESPPVDAAPLSIAAEGGEHFLEAGSASSRSRRCSFELDFS
mmetsp:Transcript_1912/g.6064  ORF Transcript_1912/g.6064 Transcript_1912/m.6064 type:complete len:216 (+) Transcript_1912:1452-2099(+)